MKIKNIMYFSVVKEESSVCDCCGKAIRNICSVTTIENEHFNFGSTCFDKIVKDRVQGFQRKEMNKTLKNIRFYCENLAKWEVITEQKYNENHNDLAFAQWKKEESFDDYKKWVITELIPYRILEEEKKLRKYSKVEF